MKHPKQFLIRCGFATLALFFNTLGLCILRLSCLGSEPVTGFCFSLHERFGLSITLCMGVLNAILMVLDVIFYRESLGFGTLTGLFITGFFADFWQWVLGRVLGLHFEFSGMGQLGFRLVLLAVGICIAVFFCSFYLAAQVGMAPYDSVGYLVQKVSHGKIPFKRTRVVQDCACVLTTVLIAIPQGTQWQIVGIGTVIMALGLGPALTFLQEKIALPFYEKIGVRKTA